MIQRCHNPNDKDYPNYGGRGITVSKEWRESFSTFLADIGNPADRTLTIDRIDNAKGYSKDNCRWASVAQQSNNKRNTKYLTVRGNTMALSAWCTLIGINSKTVLWRLKHMGMTDEAALYTPLTWTKKKQK